MEIGGNMSKDKKQDGKSWAIKITFLTFILSMSFNVISEALVGNAGLVGALFVLFAIIAIGIVCDMVGTAVTAEGVAPFNAMAANKVKGARKAVDLVSKASQVSNICNDVIGDICGIISGATVAIIIVKIAAIYNLKETVVISIILNGLVAALTVGGKALGKHISMNNSTEIVRKAAVFVELFSFRRRKS